VLVGLRSLGLVWLSGVLKAVEKEGRLLLLSRGPVV
jgi:hypothetical protein